jgi:hypothetical protein
VCLILTSIFGEIQCLLVRVVVILGFYPVSKYSIRLKMLARDKHSCLPKGRVSTVDLIIKIGCFVKNKKYSFSMNSSSSELVSTMRSTVLILRSPSIRTPCIDITR